MTFGLREFRNLLTVTSHTKHQTGKLEWGLPVQMICSAVYIIALHCEMQLISSREFVLEIHVLLFSWNKKRKVWRSKMKIKLHFKSFKISGRALATHQNTLLTTTRNPFGVKILFEPFNVCSIDLSSQKFHKLKNNQH